MNKEIYGLAVDIKETDKNKIEECLQIREVKRCEECCRYNEGCETRKGVE